MPRKSRARLTYMRPAAERIWPQRDAARVAAARRAPGRPREAAKTASASSAASARSVEAGLRSSATSACEPVVDRAAEEVGRARPEDAAGRHRVAPRLASPPTTRSAPSTAASGSGPSGPLKKASWSSPQRPSKAIHGNAAAPRPDRSGSSSRPGDLDVRAARVVAADTLLGGAAEVERLVELVRVRAGGRVDDRVGAVDDLELVVAPVRALGAFVRAVADRDGLLLRAPRARRGRRRRAGSSPSRPRAGC